MILAEFVVVSALIVVAWNVVGAAARSATAGAAAPAQSVPSPTDDPSVATPDVPQSFSPPPQAPLPGLNLSSEFWRQRLDQLNQDQVFFEQLEWRIVHSAVDAMQRYLETVVEPAVRRAEKAGA